MLRIIALALICAFVSFAQRPVGSPVTISSGPESSPFTSLYYRDGSGNIEYVCVAERKQSTFSWSTASTSLTSIVDSSNTSTVTTAADHGLSVGNPVTISGASDADLNGTYYVQTVPTSTTFTITTASVTDASYTSGITMTTTAPRTSVGIWTITKLSYTGSSIDRVQLSAGNQICDNRAVTTGATKITYQ